jgi:hypothetical protein
MIYSLLGSIDEVVAFDEVADTTATVASKTNFDNMYK